MERIAIEHGPVENANKGAGWLPMVWVNGKPERSTWQPLGYTREEAAEMARVWAEEAAARYVGDWDLTVSRREEAADV